MQGFTGTLQRNWSAGISNLRGLHVYPQSVVGQVVIGRGGGGKKRRRRKRQTIPEVQAILKAAFCNEIPAGSIVPGSCDLQVLAYDQATGVCDYLLTFDVLDATALETGLNEINNNIATNTAITEAGYPASPGTIGKFRDHPYIM